MGDRNMISTRKKAILILTVLLIGIIPILPVASSSLVDADPAFIEWKYVREITVTEQSGTQLSDYQVKILLQPDDPIWLHAQYNLSDLRFVDDSGNELPYYVEYPSRPAVLYDGVYGDWSWKTVNFPDTPAAFSIWTPQTYPTAVHFEGTYNRTYITYQSETTEGNIKMVVYDHSEKKWYGSYVVAYNPRLAGGDDRSPPAIAINESGYIWVLTADSSDILVYRSANPEDPSSWVQVTSITAGNYPNPHFNSTGHLIVLYFDKSPSGSTRPTSMAVSTDGGQTWTKKQIARLEGHWIYLVVRWSSPDTVHLAFMMCYMNDTASPYYTGKYNIYHAYSPDSGNTWYLMDGTPLTLPFGEEARIYTSFPRQLYVWDMDFDENGYPYILFIEQLSENSDKGVFKLAKWNGTAWEFHNITETDWYRDMGSIVVKSSSEIHVFINYGGPFSGVRGGEIYKFISYDGGKTWIKRPITYNSPYRHFAVQRVLNWTEDIVVVWGAGEGQPSHIFFYGRAPPAVPIPVWVKVPSIPASSTTRIYMYYGKEGVSSKSDPTAVFDFFDHFTGTLRPEWTFESLGDGGSYSLTSNLGWVTITANPYTSWYSDGDFPLLYISHPQTDFVAVAKVYINPSTNYKGGAIMVRNSANGDYYLMRRGYSNGHKIQIFSWVGNTVSSDYGILDVSAVDLYMRVRKVGNVYYWDYSEDGSTWVNLCNTTVDINPDQLGFIVATGGNTASSFSIKVDYFYVRKYVDPEPSVSLGSEAENVVVEKYIQLEGVAYIEYVDVNDTLITLSPNATLELAYSEFLNVTITADITNASQTNITVKLRSKLNLSSMSLNDTALSPVYIGNETLGNAVFNVYNVTILGNGTLTIYCTLPNVLWGIQLPSTLLVGENFTAVFPREVNATLYISAYVEVFNNTDTVTYRMQVDAKHVFKAFVEDYANLEFGCLYHEIIVTYGGFKVRAKDVFGQLPVYEPLVIVVENATTGAEIKRVSAHELDIGNLPAGLYRIKVLFRDIVVAEYLFSLNSTLSGSIVEVVSNLLKLTKDYRGYERSIVVPKGVNIIEYSSLSDRFPFSRMRVLLNGTGSFKLYINYIEDKPTKVNVVGNVTDLKYYWDGTYLVLEGSLGSVGEINITDLYKLRIEVYDRLGNRLPLKPMILINGSSYIGSIIEDYLYSENYVVELPVVIDGFSFYSFFDGFNETSRVVTINNTDVTLKAWYRVPTSFAEVSSYQLSSIWWWLPFIRQGGESVRVYIEGYLRDYYGDGVSGRLVTFNITNVETGYTRTLNATTDASGYFRTPLIELFRGETYRVDVSFAGDDIYVGTLSTYEIKPEELPVAPLPMIPLPTEYILGIIATVIIFIGLAYAVVRALRHTIAELKPRRKYVRKRRT